MKKLFLVFSFFWFSQTCFASEQQYETMSAAIRLVMHGDIMVAPKLTTTDEAKIWSREHAKFLNANIEIADIKDILWSVHYEATRAGIEPSLILAIIQVESAFKKYAVSSAGAQGLMQIMPFWKDLIGQKNQNLFSIRINIRYGCIIFRHYLNKENGDLVGALSRYNGTKKDTRYADSVLSAYRKLS